jgi:peptidoglycan hydrolase-like protein with peptidoglycan-binding domain
MFFASKIGWAGIAFTLLTTGMLVPSFPRSAPVSDSSKKGVTAFVIKNEIKKMQETLRNKGYYEGKVDGVFGLRTRAGIRAYQKTEHLPITGQVDPRTAEGLGLRPELTWDNSKSAGREAGPDSHRASGEIKRDKPSASIRCGKGSRRTSKTLRKPVETAIAPESGRGDREKTLQAENEKHPQ